MQCETRLFVRLLLTTQSERLQGLKCQMKDISSSQHHVAVNDHNIRASSESHVSEIHIMQFGITSSFLREVI